MMKYHDFVVILTLNNTLGSKLIFGSPENTCLDNIFAWTFAYEIKFKPLIYCKFKVTIPGGGGGGGGGVFD